MSEQESHTLCRLLVHCSTQPNFAEIIYIDPWSGLKVRTQDEDATFKWAFIGILTWNLLLRLTGLYNSRLDYTRIFNLIFKEVRETLASLTLMVDPYFWRPKDDQLLPGQRCCCPVLVAVPAGRGPLMGAGGYAWAAPSACAGHRIDESSSALAQQMFLWLQRTG